MSLRLSSKFPDRLDHPLYDSLKGVPAMINKVTPSSRLPSAHRDDGIDFLIAKVTAKTPVGILSPVTNTFPLYDTRYILTRETERRWTQHVSYLACLGRTEENADGSHIYPLTLCDLPDASTLALMQHGIFLASPDDINVISLTPEDPGNTLCVSECLPTPSSRHHDYGTCTRMTIANWASIVYC